MRVKKTDSKVNVLNIPNLNLTSEASCFSRKLILLKILYVWIRYFLHYLKAGKLLQSCFNSTDSQYKHSIICSIDFRE